MIFEIEIFGDWINANFYRLTRWCGDRSAIMKKKKCHQTLISMCRWFITAMAVMVFFFFYDAAYRLKIDYSRKKKKNVIRHRLISRVEYTT